MWITLQIFAILVIWKLENLLQVNCFSWVHILKVSQWNKLPSKCISFLIWVSFHLLFFLPMFLPSFYIPWFSILTFRNNYKFWKLWICSICNVFGILVWFSHITGKEEAIPLLDQTDFLVSKTGILYIGRLFYYWVLIKLAYA